MRLFRRKKASEEVPPEVIYECVRLLKQAPRSPRGNELERLEMAAELLGQVPAPHSVPVLVQIVETSDASSLRRKAAQSLVIYGRVIRALGHDDQSAVETLVAALRSDRPRQTSVGDLEYEAIVDALGSFGNPLAIDALVARYRTTGGRPVLAAKIARALGEIGDERALPSLIRLLKQMDADGFWGYLDPYVRESRDLGAQLTETVNAIARIGGSTAVKALSECLDGCKRRSAAHFALDLLTEALAAARQPRGPQ